MIKRRIFILLTALFLLPALTWADTFSSMGTRWPSGLKKTLVGNNDTLFAANGDVVAAYNKDTMAYIDQIILSAPEGIVALDYMEIEAGAGLPDNQFIVVACGTGGLQVIPFADGQFSSTEDSAIVTRSDTARANENTPAALDIKGCVSFKAHSDNLIATMDDNFGYRVFHLTQSSPPALNEVAQQELSNEAFTMLVDLDRWEKDPTRHGILTVAKNRELGLLEMAKDLHGKWSIEGLGRATINLPTLPSTELLYFSSLTLRVSGDSAQVIENSMGYFFSFALSDHAPYLLQTYPQPDTEGISFGYPLDLAFDGPHTYITTLMEKDGNTPGVQVMDLSSKSVVGTLAQDGAGALHKHGEHLFSMDLKNGLSKLKTDTPSPIRDGSPVPTPFAAHELLARETYLFLADGLASPKGGFRIIDISNAAQPKRIRFEATPGRAGDLAVDGDFYRLFIADGDEGVRCYSMNGSFVTADYDPASPVPSPEAPLLLETLSSAQFDGESVLKVSVSSKNINGVNVDVLHALSANGNLFSFPLPLAASAPIIHVIDTSKKITFGDIPGTPVSMAPFLHDYLLVAAGDQGLQIVDLFSDANNPGTLTPAIEASYVSGLSQTVSVASDDSRYAYVADNSGGIVAFDLFSDQNTPALINLSMVGNFPLAAGHFLDLFVTDNNNAYTVTDQTYGNIQILDVSNPSAITHLGSETTLGAPRAVVAVTTGGLSPDTPALRAAYVADGQGGLSIRQTTNDDNSQEQTWSDDSTSCFIHATH
ncbi:hypothetical protein DSLASN_17480 [Desulfoluna limicola]|uniref:LVIVD repeat protein n=1 Tax=Desulfoluna limicola TaxID=2810562 RepID=A0ABN6F2H8_9BACT|nr:hypothetical protein [Desulfoluna limicola]BCS96116.1 hypothetical protein DSLASN_17480 [Desulfoluna limicola]